MNCEISCCLDVEQPCLADVTVAVSQLMGFLRDHGVSDSVFLAEFELAMAEALNNAVEHGCAGRAEQFFHVRLVVRAEGVELRVDDPSDFRGWEGAAELPEDLLQERGRGHFLMARMADELQHLQEDGRHVLLLRKRFKQAPWHYEPGASDEVLREMTDEVVAIYEMISTLLGLGEWLATAPDFNGFCQGALRRLCEVTEADFAYFRVEKDGELVLLFQWGEAVRSPCGSLAPAAVGMEREVFRTGQEMTLPSGMRLPPEDPLCGVFDSAVILPVLFQHERRGILVIGRNRAQSFFEAGKLKIARVVADYLGIVERMNQLQTHRAAEERVLRDLEIAAQIQLSLMPQDFSMISDLDFYGCCRPALRAGGDYFDVLTLRDGSVLCMVADVMGKGISAAILATMLRANVHALVAGGESDPGLILTRLNSWMSSDLIRLNMFVTIACVVFSPQRQFLSFSGAGHLPGFLQTAYGDFAEISVDGIPIGIFSDSTYGSTQHVFAPGDRFIMLTDGITEAASPAGEFFEKKGICESLARSRYLSSRETVEQLLHDVVVFTQGQAPSDDRTVLVITRPLEESVPPVPPSSPPLV